MSKRLIPVVLLLTAARCLAQFPDETGRLMAAARLWITIDYFHPAVAGSDAEWQNALLSALPKIRSASNPQEFGQALAGMLDQLHDPETGFLPPMGLNRTFSALGPQMTVARTAQGVRFLVNPEPSGPKTIALELADRLIAVRLSAPAGSIPTIQKNVVPPADAYPNTEWRLLAAFKVWGPIHYFFAYKDLMDEDWDDVFAASLPKFIEARDATDYNLALADLLTRVADSNTASHSKTLDSYFGEAPAGLDLRLLDKYPVVSAVWDAAAEQAGVHPGDILKRVGNESTTDRFRRLVQYVPASTAQRSGYDTIQKITNGPAGSEVELATENAKGETHVVKLRREIHDPRPQRSTRTIEILPGNIGYLDLDRLPESEAEAALTQLSGAKGIIFDLRGRAPAAVTIVHHLTASTNVAAALVNTPFPIHPDIATQTTAVETTTTFTVRTLPLPLAPRYTGKTVALIDERTIGEAEYAGLLFQAANKTEFIGAPSAGAETEIAELMLPGGITVTYSARDIRLGNGGKLQRLGLQPGIAAPTTAKGLHAGRDEALEAALKHLSQ